MRGQLPGPNKKTQLDVESLNKPRIDFFIKDTSTCQNSDNKEPDVKQEEGKGSDEKEQSLSDSNKETNIKVQDELTGTKQDSDISDQALTAQSKNKRIVDDRPEDLITAQQAAQMSGKSKNTIRAWVRQEKLTGYRQNPKKSNSALMISKGELMIFLATDATPTPSDSKVGRPELESASVAKLRLENQELQAKVNALEQEKEFLRQMLDHQKELIKELQNGRNLLMEQNKLSRLDLEREIDKTERLQMRVERLTTYFALPFWKRWNSAVLELENKN